MNKAAELLLATPGFAALNPETVEALTRHARLQRFEAGEALFLAGETFKQVVYLLEEGNLELEDQYGGREPVQPGHLVGLSAYFTNDTYHRSAVARNAVQTWELSAATMREMEAAHLDLFDAFNRLIVAKIRKGRSLPEDTSALPIITPPRWTPDFAPVAMAMSTPVKRCAACLNLRQALAAMTAANVGALVVVDSQGKPLGVVSYRSLALHLATKGIDPDTEAVSAAMETAHTLNAEAPLWEAQELHHIHGTKHLVVVENTRPVGVLSQTDVVKALLTRHSGIRLQTKRATQICELKACYEQIPAVAEEAMHNNRRARVAVRVLSDAHLSIQRRCVELTLNALDEEGLGSPPTEYAFIVMGSGGRREMMLDPDQDNALILARDPNDEEYRWYKTFAERLNVNLDTIGYVLCPGDIMARNPSLLKSLAQWKTAVDERVKHPGERAARWSNIIFDFDTVFGDPSLARRLRNHLNEAITQRPLLLQHMVEDDAGGQVPLGWFNRLSPTTRPDGRAVLDIKRHGLRLVANAARILALHDGLDATNTSDRIHALVRSTTLSPDFAAAVDAAYDQLLDVVLFHQITQTAAGGQPDKYVAPDELDPITRESLRVAMRSVKRFQDFLQAQVGLAPGFYS